MDYSKILAVLKKNPDALVGAAGAGVGLGDMALSGDTIGSGTGQGLAGSLIGGAGGSALGKTGKQKLLLSLFGSVLGGSLASGFQRDRRRHQKTWNPTEEDKKKQLAFNLEMMKKGYNVKDPYDY